MNLFVLDLDPAKAAQNLCNLHVIKMPTESANILLAPFSKLGCVLPSTKHSGKPFRISHPNHPATLFAQKSYGNYVWVLNNMREMCAEYSFRYGKRHYSENYLDYAVENMDKLSFDSINLTHFPRCFGDFKEKIDKNLSIVDAYREFYRLDKRDFATWPEGKVPAWWI